MGCGRAAINTALVAFGTILLVGGCGPTAEEQRVMDQDRCIGFGFAPNTDAFAHCMMGTSMQRDSEAAADRRAAAARDAADKRASDAAQAAKDAADRDAWDKRTGQGKYSSFSFPDTKSSPNPVDAIRDQIEQEQRKAEGAE